MGTLGRGVTNQLYNPGGLKRMVGARGTLRGGSRADQRSLKHKIYINCNLCDKRKGMPRECGEYPGIFANGQYPAISNDVHS